MSWRTALGPSIVVPPQGTKLEASQEVVVQSFGKTTEFKKSSHVAKLYVAAPSPAKTIWFENPLQRDEAQNTTKLGTDPFKEPTRSQNFRDVEILISMMNEKIETNHSFSRTNRM